MYPIINSATPDLIGMLHKNFLIKNDAGFADDAKLKYDTLKKQIETKLFSSINKDYIFTITLESNNLKISFTKDGYKHLQKEVKNIGTTIKKYLNSIVNGN